jgi:hypothetical protein
VKKKQKRTYSSAGIGSQSFVQCKILSLRFFASSHFVFFRPAKSPGRERVRFFPSASEHLVRYRRSCRIKGYRKRSRLSRRPEAANRTGSAAPNVCLHLGNVTTSLPPSPRRYITDCYYYIQREVLRGFHFEYLVRRVSVSSLDSLNISLHRTCVSAYRPHSSLEPAVS